MSTFRRIASFEARLYAAERTASKMDEFLKEHGDKKVRNPDTGNDVKLKSLKGDKGKKLLQKEFEKWNKAQKGKGDDKGGGGDMKSKATSAGKALQSLFKEDESGFLSSMYDDALDILKDIADGKADEGDIEELLGMDQGGELNELEREEIDELEEEYDMDEDPDGYDAAYKAVEKKYDAARAINKKILSEIKKLKV